MLGECSLRAGSWAQDQEESGNGGGFLPKGKKPGLSALEAAIGGLSASDELFCASF